jgi:hypothetical protein
MPKGTVGVTGKRQGSQNNQRLNIVSDVLAAEPKLLATFVRPYIKIVLFLISTT